MSLHRAAARGALVTGVAQVFRIAFQLVSTVVLARLMAPSDYGVLAMVAVLIGLGELLRDAGLSFATVQAREVSDAQQSNLFWLNVAVATGLAVAAWLGAPWLARFYGEPRVVPVCQALAATFLINGAAAQYGTRLNRAMAFGRMAQVDLTAMVMAAALAITLAMQGFGLWALVAQRLAHSLIALLLMVHFTGWRPGWPQRHATIRPFLRYGWALLGVQLVNFGARSVDALVIGHRFGGEALGLYNRAFQLLMVPFTQLSAPSTAVALPLLSRIDDRNNYLDVLVRAQNVFMHAMALPLALLMCWADPLIPWVLGQRWADAVPIFRILAVGCLFQVAGYACYWVFLSRGLTQRHLGLSLVTRPVMIGLMVVGAYGGPQGVAMGYVAGLAVAWLGALVALRDDRPLVRRLAVNALVVIVTYGLAAGGGAAMAHVLAQGPVSRLLWSGMGLALTLSLQVVVNRRFRGSLSDSLRSVRKMVSKGVVSA